MLPLPCACLQLTFYVHTHTHIGLDGHQIFSGKEITFPSHITSSHFYCLCYYTHFCHTPLRTLPAYLHTKSNPIYLLSEIFLASPLPIPPSLTTNSLNRRISASLFPICINTDKSLWLPNTHAHLSNKYIIFVRGGGAGEGAR